MTVIKMHRRAALPERSEKVKNKKKNVWKSR